MAESTLEGGDDLKAAGEAEPEQARPPQAAPRRGNVSVNDLPQYARSLLRIKVPVVVTLAEKRQPLGRILELGPGSIIQFDKSCDEMLGLDVGQMPVAVGEAVKVGDKFGLRITSIVLPEERFAAVKPAAAEGGH
jgi:flagellar motor switch protein FliN/FliY